MSTDEKVKTYWENFPEAPASSTFKWVDERGFEHMTTIRGWTFSTMLDSLDKATSAVIGLNGRPSGKVIAPVAPAPEPDVATKIIAEENPQLAAQMQAEGEEVPPAPDGQKWNTTDCVYVRILPQPDQKVTIEYFANDKKQPRNDYASIKVNKWPVAQAAGLMKHVTNADVSQPAEYSLPCRVYWLEGKEFTKPDGSTGRYKNVHHVRRL